jgi:hypothetical protein
MNLLHKYFVSLSFFACAGPPSEAQSDTTAISADTTYTMAGNTLSTNQGFKIVVGQPIIIGEASGEQGWYRSITFKSPAAWPVLLFREQELSQNLDYQLDESIRDKDKVKGLLAKGDTLTVVKIKRFDNKRAGNQWYVVLMRLGQGLLSVNFRCYIMDAIRLGEVILPKP